MATGNSKLKLTFLLTHLDPSFCSAARTTPYRAMGAPCEFSPSSVHRRAIDCHKQEKEGDTCLPWG